MPIADGDPEDMPLLRFEIFSRCAFVPGDQNNQGLKDRGLSFEMILEVTGSGGWPDGLPDAAHPGQVVLAVEVAGYVHAVPCERRGEDLRMITAFSSGKLQPPYHR
jgi:hypothetical protein